MYLQGPSARFIRARLPAGKLLDRRFEPFTTCILPILPLCQIQYRRIETVLSSIIIRLSRNPPTMRRITSFIFLALATATYQAVVKHAPAPRVDLEYAVYEGFYNVTVDLVIWKRYASSSLHMKETEREQEPKTHFLIASDMLLHQWANYDGKLLRSPQKPRPQIASFWLLISLPGALSREPLAFLRYTASTPTLAMKTVCISTSTHHHKLRNFPSLFGSVSPCLKVVMIKPPSRADTNK
ncbi:hypothetical protein V8C42DRAFT_164170 [Trichoderma barbatum]